MKLLNKLLNLFTPKVYTKDFWDKVYMEYTTNKSASLSYFICNNSPTFNKMWNNRKNKYRIIKLANGYLDLYDGNFKELFNVGSYTLFTPKVHTNYSNHFNHTIDIIKETRVRFHFIKYCIKKSK